MRPNLWTENEKQDVVVETTTTKKEHFWNNQREHSWSVIHQLCVGSRRTGLHWHVSLMICADFLWRKMINKKRSDLFFSKFRFFFSPNPDFDLMQPLLLASKTPWHISGLVGEVGSVPVMVVGIWTMWSGWSSGNHTRCLLSQDQIWSRTAEMSAVYVY